MKRLFWMGLAVLTFVLLLAGCVPDQNKGGTSQIIEQMVNLTIDGKEATLEGGSDIEVGVVMADFDNSGWIAIFTGMINEAIRQDVSVRCYSANNDADRQIALIDQLIADEVDAILFIPTNSEKLSAAVNAAREAGVPIVAADRSVASAVPDALVESDNIQIGRTAAEQMYALSDGKMLNILALQGDLMTSAGYERDRGFQEGIRLYDNCVVTVSAETQWKADLGYNAILQAFRDHPEINAIYLPSDLYTQGAVSALEILGRLKPTDHPEHVIIVSVDGHPIGLENIRKQYVDIDVGQRLYAVGGKAMNSCISLAKGEVLKQKIIRMQPQVIKHDNVDSEDFWANLID